MRFKTSIAVIACTAFLTLGTTAAQARLSANGLSMNALNFNALSFNGLRINGLHFNGLQLNGHNPKTGIMPLRSMAQAPLAGEVSAQ